MIVPVVLERVLHEAIANSAIDAIKERNGLPEYTFPRSFWTLNNVQTLMTPILWRNAVVIVTALNFGQGAGCGI